MSVSARFGAERRMTLVREAGLAGYARSDGGGDFEQPAVGAVAGDQLQADRQAGRGQARPGRRRPGAAVTVIREQERIQSM